MKLSCPQKREIDFSALGSLLGVSNSSHQKGPDRCHNNQLITGNIGRSTLDLLLIGRIKAERISVGRDIPSMISTCQPKAYGSLGVTLKVLRAGLQTAIV